MYFSDTQVMGGSVEDPTAAAAMLHQVRRVQERAVKAGPREWLVQMAWAVWVLLFIPPFDLIRGDIWGPVVLASSAVGTILCYRYYLRAYGRVHPLTPKQWRVWLWWSPWYGAWIVFANLFKDQIPVASTIAAVASAAPLLGYAVRNRHRAALQ
jgi:hypothetical protein